MKSSSITPCFLKDILLHQIVLRHQRNSWKCPTPLPEQCVQIGKEAQSQSQPARFNSIHYEETRGGLNKIPPAAKPPQENLSGSFPAVISLLNQQKKSLSRKAPPRCGGRYLSETDQGVTESRLYQPHGYCSFSFLPLFQSL